MVASEPLPVVGSIALALVRPNQSNASHAYIAFRALSTVNVLFMYELFKYIK